MKTKIKYLGLLLVSLFLFACSKESEEPVNPLPEEKIEVKTEEVEIVFPKEIDKSLLDGLVVSNAYGEHSINYKKEVTTKSSSNNYLYGSKIGYVSDGLMLTNVLDSSGGMLMCYIDEPTPQASRKLRIDAQETALTVLMFHPFLITDDKEEHYAIRNALLAMPEFKNYKNQVYNALVDGLKNKYTPYYGGLSGYQRVINALLRKSISNGKIGTTSLVKLNVTKRENNKLTFTITNEHKRVLHMYAKKAKTSNKGIVLSEEYVKGTLGFPLMDYLIPESADYWEIVKQGLLGDDSSPFKKTSEPITVDLGDADKLYYEIYGIGKMSKPFNQFTEEEQAKILLVYLHGIYNDVFKPIKSLITGVKDLKNASGKDSFKYDLRYGSRKSPEMQLIKGLIKDLGNSPKTQIEIFKNVYEKEYLKAGETLALFCINQVFGNNQKEEVKARYMNNIYQIIKNSLGVTKVSDKMRKQFKDVANQISHVVNANFVKKTITLAELGVDISGAVFTYYNTEVKHTIIENKEEKTEVILKYPEDNAELNKLNVKFEWDFNRADVVGAVKYDLIFRTTDLDGNFVTKKFEDIKETFKEVNLDEIPNNGSMTTYRWKVLARKDQGNDFVIVESPEYKFRVDKINNDIPEGVLIENGVLKKWPCDAIPENRHVTIPNSVTSIESGAFYRCTSLSSITIPNSVTSIGNNAFSYCSSLVSFVVDDRNSEYSSENGVLFNKNKTLLIQFPKDAKNYIIPNSVTSIGDFAFEGCTSLSSVAIPNSVTSIGNYAFYNCTSLSSITIPNSVTYIGAGAFDNCTSLSSITIPNSITSIGLLVFQDCTSLSSIIIPDSVTRIKFGAFVGCTSLSSITIPNSVTSIGNFAFKGCTSLKDVKVLTKTPPVVEKEDLGYSGKVTVPKGTKSAYETAVGWKYCRPIVEE